MTRARNKFSETWWTNIKDQIQRKCKPGQYQDDVGMVCCHEEGKQTDPKKACHIPWAFLENLKIANKDGGKTKVPLPEKRAKMYCYNFDENFMPLSLYAGKMN